MKKGLALLLILALAASASAALAEEPIRITFFDKNTGDAFSDPIADEIVRRTGVFAEIQQPSADPTEKLSLMLISGDYPDVLLMDRSSEIVTKYITAQALVPLNDLIDEYGSNIQQMYGNVLNKSRFTDGQNYYLNNWYGQDNDPVWAVLMRMDYLQEIVGEERALSGEPFSTSELVEVLKGFQEKYPEINGQTPSAMTLNGQALMGHVTGVFTGWWGVKKYYEVDGELSYVIKDPAYYEGLRFANELYRAGLIDPEWPVAKDDLWRQKLASDLVFSTTGAYWDPGDANTALRDAHGEGSQFYPFKVVPDGADPASTTLGGRSSLGWDAIAITRNNKYPVETIKFLDFLASEEGQHLILWGLEGVNYDITDGKRVPKPELVSGLMSDWNATVKETGVRRWIWCVKNGLDSTGQPYDINQTLADKVTAFARAHITDTYYDTADYDGLEPDGGTPEAMIHTNINERIQLAIPSIINAETEEQCRQLYDQLISEIDAAGAPQVEAVINQKYTQRKELWGGV